MNTNKNVNTLLKKRAKQLASASAADSAQEDRISALEFMLGEERYAIEAVYIKEVYSFKEVSLLPNVPSFIYGLINVRRKIVSIVDLRRLFDLPINSQKMESKAIILEQGEMDFGILVEEIIGLKKISCSDLQNYLPNLSKCGQEFLKGITQDRLVLLDGNKLLNSSSLIVNQGDE